MKPLIIGLGSIGKKHVKALQCVLSNAEIFALRSKNISEKVTGITDIFSYDDIASIDPDFAIIANPTSEHIKTISRLIEYKIPLFIEKPLHYNLNIEKLIKSVNKSGIFTYVACNLRFLDCLRFIKERGLQIKRKRLNEVNVYCGSYLPDWRPGLDFRNTYSAIRELGGGVHIDLIHEIDYLYWLFGNPKNVSRNFRNQSSLEIQTYDFAHYLIDYEGFCTNVTLNYYRRDTKRSMELVFEDETWYVDLLKNHILSNDQKIFSSEQRIYDTYKAQMEYFINCMKNGDNSFNTINDAYNVLKICLGNDIKR